MENRADYDAKKGRFNQRSRIDALKDKKRRKKLKKKMKKEKANSKSFVHNTSNNVSLNTPKAGPPKTGPSSGVPKKKRRKTDHKGGRQGFRYQIVESSNTGVLFTKENQLNGTVRRTYTQVFTSPVVSKEQ